MNRLFHLLLPIAFISSCVAHGGEQVVFENYFSNKTLRLDYAHSGNATSEEFCMKHLIDDGVWAGRTKTLINPYRLGVYFYEIYDVTSGALIYSEGINTVFSEWQTIAEAKEKTLTFNESIRLPLPKKQAKLLMYKRDSVNALNPIWEYIINPTDVAPLATSEVFNCPVVPLVANGDCASKVDIVILGDGYTPAEMDKFRGDAGFFVESFFSVEPFKSRKSDFNVRMVEVPSENSGVQYPSQNYYPNNPLKTSYSTFGIDRYVLTYDDWTFRSYAALAPYDFAVILLNSTKYGGGGIYNLYITAAARSHSNGYVMVHEMGHHIAALADEYYSSEVAYAPASTSIEPWEFNVTALLNRSEIKWGGLIKEGTPIPTPWAKSLYDVAGRNRDTLLVNDRTVGAFEGANYLSKGMYRSEVNCIMFAQADYFCAVCNDGINKILDLYIK